MIRSNISGTMAGQFSIGKNGPTIHQGTDDPNAAQMSGALGDLYVKLGQTPTLYQFRSSKWIDLDPNVVAASLTYRQTFTASDLGTSGVLVIQHNLGEDFPIVQIYNNNREVIVPDQIVGDDSNSVMIALDSYGNITGNWTVVIRK